MQSWVRQTIDKVWKIRKKKKADCRPMRNQFCNWCAWKEGHCPEFADPITIQRNMEISIQERNEKRKERKLLKEQGKL
jgi:hypothetical protein